MWADDVCAWDERFRRAMVDLCFEVGGLNPGDSHISSEKALLSASAVAANGVVPLSLGAATHTPQADGPEGLPTSPGRLRRTPKMDFEDDHIADLPAALAGGEVGRSLLSGEVRLAHRRRRLNRSVISVFAERGYQRTTITDLVAFGKISTGGFYELYAGKEECFLAVLEECLEATRGRIAAAIDSSAAWPQRLRAVLEAVASMIETEPETAKLILLVAPTAGAAAGARYDLALNELADLLRSGRALAPGGAAVPESHEFTAVAGISWVLRDRLSRGETAGIGAVLQELEHFLLAAYTAADPDSSAISRPSSSTWESA